MNTHLHIKNRARGFTLIEMMIAILFFTMLFGMSIMFGISAIRVQELDRATQTIRNELVLSRDYAQSGREESSWGIAFATSSVIQFKGDDYASRDAGYDLETTFESNVAISGLSEVTFEPPFGYASASGTVYVQSNEHQAEIHINSYGMIQIEN